MKNIGLCFGYESWGLWYSEHGFGAGWLPFQVQRFIVSCWNKIKCLLLGHNDVIHEYCIECRKQISK